MTEALESDLVANLLLIASFSAIVAGGLIMCAGLAVGRRCAPVRARARRATQRGA